MEDAVQAGVHELAAFGPEWLFAIIALIVVVVLLIAFVPVVKATIEKRLEIADNESKERIELERKREERKAAEELSREQRDRERSEMEGRWAAQNDRAIAAQEKSNVVLESLKNQMELMNAQMMDSKASSKSMGEIVATMAHQVDEIHRITTK